MSERKGITIRQMFFLQLVVIIYTLAGVSAKFASFEEFLSFKFILLYGLEILILGIYAVLWQQIIKRIDLSVAYANRSMALLWSMLWAFIIFQEKITIRNLLGVIIVITGTLIVNTEGRKEEKNE